MVLPLRVLTLRTSLYTYICSQVHISYYRYFCVWLRNVQTHLCLCPCECSHLEPLCIHAYTHKYTYIISKKLLYVYRCCANSNMPVPLPVLALRTSLHTYICSQVYIFDITDFELLCITPCCANSHMSVPLRVLTVRTSLYTCIYLQEYINHITDWFVYEPMLCELTNVCALASAHT